MRDPTSKLLGLGQGTAPLFDYMLVSDLYFMVRDPTFKFLGLGSFYHLNWRIANIALQM